MKVERLSRLTSEAADSLKETVSENALISAYISNGIAELWKIDNGGSYAVIVFDRIGVTVWILCYAGREVSEFIRRLKIASRKDGYKRLVFATHKPGIVRLMRKSGFKEYSTLCEVSL